MATQTQPGSLAEQIMALTTDRKYEDLEALWLDNVPVLPGKNAFYKKWLIAMKKNGAMPKAEGMIAVMAEDRLERGKIKFALRVILLCLGAYPQGEILREPLIKALRALYGENNEFDAVLKASGMDEDTPPARAVQMFDALIRLTPGQVYEHHDWGVGVIDSFDMKGKSVKLSFPGYGEREMTPEGVRKFLRYLDPDHFLARRIREPEKMRELGDEDPVALVKLALKNQNDRQCKQSDLKAMLSPALIATGNWTSWWARAREGLKFDPYIEFDATGGAHAVLKLRDDPKTFDEEVEEIFFAPDATLADQSTLIQSIVKRPKDSTVTQELAERMAKKLVAEHAAMPAEDAAVRLKVGYMLDDLAQALPGAEIAVPDWSDDLAALTEYGPILELENPDYAARALETVVSRDGVPGQLHALELLAQAPLKLAQAIWRLANPARHHNETVMSLNRVLGDPFANPETYAWAVRNLLDGSWSALAEDFPPISLVPDLFDAIDQWQHRVEQGAPKEDVATARLLLTKARSALSVNKYDPVCVAVAEMTPEAAARFLHGIHINDGLPSVFKKEVERFLKMTRKDFVEPATVDDDEEGVLMCTARAHYEKTMELRDIKSVKLPKVTKAIEEARAEGDLKENAGYQYAKEEQRLLNQRMMTIAQQLSGSRIIKGDDVDATRAGFGTCLNVKNLDSGEEQSITILGRWEANPEKNILSHEAPMPTQFLGHVSGDTVDIKFPGGGGAPFEILSIEGVLDSGDWDAPAGD